MEQRHYCLALYQNNEEVLKAIRLLQSFAVSEEYYSVFYKVPSVLQSDGAKQGKVLCDGTLLKNLGFFEMSHFHIQNQDDDPGRDLTVIFELIGIPGHLHSDYQDALQADQRLLTTYGSEDNVRKHYMILSKSKTEKPVLFLH